MASVSLISHNLIYLPVIAEKVSAGQVARKGIEYYLAWHESHTTEDLCRHLKEAAQKYPSVLEHVVFTFYIEGCSRVCSHQLVRHRLASYTQESQRYSMLNCDWEGIEKARAVLGAALRAFEEHEVSEYDLNSATASARDTVRDCVELPITLSGYNEARALKHILDSLSLYRRLIGSGAEPEDARFILPQAIKTRLLMTVNLRELLHIARLRTSEAAQWEIRSVVNEMVDAVRNVIPCIWELVEVYEG